MDLSGMDLPYGQEIPLIAANSMPKSTYAAVRVDSTIPPSGSPAEIASIIPADIQDMQTENRQNLQKLLPLQGGQLIELLGTRIEKISGYPAIVTEYVALARKGLFRPNQPDIHFQPGNWDRSVIPGIRGRFWQAVIAKIRQSTIVRRWP